MVSKGEGGHGLPEQPMIRRNHELAGDSLRAPAFSLPLVNQKPRRASKTKRIITSDPCTIPLLQVQGMFSSSYP